MTAPPQAPSPTNGHTNGHASLNGGALPQFRAPAPAANAVPHQQHTPVTNGHQTPDGDGDLADVLLAGVPDVRTLDRVIERGEQLLARVNNPALRSGLLTNADFIARQEMEKRLRDRRLQEEEAHELALIELSRTENEKSRALRAEEIDASARQAETRRKTEQLVLDADLDSKKHLAAQQGKALKAAAAVEDALRAEEDTPQRLVKLKKWRDRVRVGAFLIATGAIAAGATNVGHTLGRLFDDTELLLRVAYGALETFASLPLLVILVVQMLIGRRRYTGWRDRFSSTEWKFETAFLAIAVFLNVAPHLLFDKPEWKGLLWLWVPTALVLVLRLGTWAVGRLDDAMRDLIIDAGAKLPANRVETSLRTMLHRAGILHRSVESGEYVASGKRLAEDGAPSASGAMKVLKEHGDKLGTEATYQVLEAYRHFNNIAPPEEPETTSATAAPAPARA